MAIVTILYFDKIFCYLAFIFETLNLVTMNIQLCFSSLYNLASSRGPLLEIGYLLTLLLGYSSFIWSY